MKKQFLEAGKIVNTHGIAGEVKVQPWCDEPELLTQLDTLYWADESPVRVLGARAHKNCVLMRLEGISHIDQAELVKNKILYLDRDDVTLPEDQVFIQDMLGLPVWDEFSQRQIGLLEDVQDMPAGPLLIVKEGSRQHLIPCCEPFLKAVEEERIVVETIEGMVEDEN